MAAMPSPVMVFCLFRAIYLGSSKLRIMPFPAMISLLASPKFTFLEKRTGCLEQGNDISSQENNSHQGAWDKDTWEAWGFMQVKLQHIAIII